MLVTVRTDLELRLLMSMPWALIILKTEHNHNKWSFYFSPTHKVSAGGSGTSQGRYKCLSSFSGSSDCTVLHHPLQQIYLSLGLSCLPWRDALKDWAEREMTQRWTSWVPLDMLFIVLLQVQGDYNKSYSSCAWHLCCEIDKCLIVYFGGRDDL